MINPEIWKHFGFIIAVDPGLSTGNGIVSINKRGMFSWNALKTSSKDGSFEQRLLINLRILEDMFSAARGVWNTSGEAFGLANLA